MNNQKFSLDIRNILTPSEELSFEREMEPINGILKDRFTLTLNPMVYNPSDAEMQLRFRTKKIIDSNFGVGQNYQFHPKFRTYLRMSVLFSFRYRLLITE